MISLSSIYEASRAARKPMTGMPPGIILQGHKRLPLSLDQLA
ncbi:hypothetical protein SAMN05444678_1374 [Sphingomonas sp. YR710]|nr:hypothetical protein SAMN05444678_1374 [Sphingomonas sp. YR710]